MGLLERFRPSGTEEWRPPAFGACRCETHIEDVLEEHIPLADGSGSLAVADLVGTGGLTTVPAPPDRHYLLGTVANERRGPFHWLVMHQDRLEVLLAPAAPVGLDDSLFVQPGVERVLWLDRAELAIGAPRLCARGVQGAVVRALLNPRVRGDGQPG